MGCRPDGCRLSESHSIGTPVHFEPQRTPRHGELRNCPFFECADLVSLWPSVSSVVKEVFFFTAEDAEDREDNRTTSCICEIPKRNGTPNDVRCAVLTVPFLPLERATALPCHRVTVSARSCCRRRRRSRTHRDGCGSSSSLHSADRSDAPRRGSRCRCGPRRCRCS